MGRSRKGKTEDLTIGDLQAGQSANLGTARGLEVLEESVRQHGAGRGIVVDRNGVVICGAKVLEAARAAGIDKLRIVRTEGARPVVVKRTDLSLAEGGQAAELAILDNRAGELNLFWDASLIAAIGQGIDLGELGMLGLVQPSGGFDPPGDRQSPEGQSVAGAQVRIASLQMNVSAADYDAWNQQICAQVGFAREAIEQEIKRRLEI